MFEQTLKLTCAHCSHAGQREANEDALGTRIRDQDACFVLSDGVGGERGGGQAARLAIQGALQRFENHPPQTLEALAQSSMAAAHASIVAEQQRNPERARMAATLVGLFIDRRLGLARWAHAGDSRLYQFRRGVLMQRTHDHSLVAQLAAAGLPHDNVNPNLLSQALGRQDMAPSASATSWPLEDGDAYLLCTDGFWHALADHELEAQLQLADSVEDWITLLAHQVSRHGAHDNYSAIAVWVGNPQSITLARVGGEAA
ncbi:PP2C family protein-serine/threonine phosphatase [Andreprevotia chitinilytica]|uniref:PP2C family protein-serine/threonine phosphatase n=1 Tax=Andreprevotia chitinilytica TaxID=396808 RepID=UPI000556A6D1|nr:PP2C family serine/threonine-protein phosphatase [Andreprevotia chitinilytica]